MEGVIFTNKFYNELELPEKSLIYADPPYFGATKYFVDFDHEKFWQWVRDISKLGHTVFTSEYTAPNDFSCVWSKDVKSSLSANKTSGGNKDSVEKLFKLKE